MPDKPMIAVEPTVTEEKLRQLLDAAVESAFLDYKTRCDLRQKGELIEIAKDVGAMQIEGGFLVIGADEHGRPTGKLLAEHAPQFDESRLRAKLLKYLPEPLLILSAVHQIGAARLALVWVGPNPKGFAVFKADGTYVAEGKVVTAFHRGDVFARHGSASEPWNQSDIDKVRSRIVESEKELWRVSLAEDIRLVGVGAEARGLARAPAGALNWNVDDETFESTIIEQLRNDDDIPLRLLLERVPIDALHVLQSDDPLGDLGTLLDRIVCVGALSIRLDKKRNWTAVIEALSSVYDLGFEATRGRTQVAGPVIWLAILERVIALGGLAVRKHDWTAVRDLAIHRGENSEDWRYFRTWLRHGLTEAARSNLFTQQQGDRAIELSIISFAHGHAQRLACLRAGRNADDEAVLNSLCQFDFLGVMAAIAEANSTSDEFFYTSFARFRNSRTEPIVARLVADAQLRTLIFPNDDTFLATAFRTVDALARRESFRFAGWDGYTDKTVRAFLEAHPAVGAP